MCGVVYRKRKWQTNLKEMGNRRRTQEISSGIVIEFTGNYPCSSSSTFPRDMNSVFLPHGINHLSSKPKIQQLPFSSILSTLHNSLNIFYSSNLISLLPHRFAAFRHSSSFFLFSLFQFPNTQLIKRSFFIFFFFFWVLFHFHESGSDGYSGIEDVGFSEE